MATQKHIVHIPRNMFDMILTIQLQLTPRLTNIANYRGCQIHKNLQ